MTKLRLSSLFADTEARSILIVNNAELPVQASHMSAHPYRELDGLCGQNRRLSRPVSCIAESR